MKVRAIANNSVYDVDDELGRAMVKSGIYVVAEVDAAPSEKPKNKNAAAKYKRRDLTAEDG